MEGGIDKTYAKNGGPRRKRAHDKEHRFGILIKFFIRINQCNQPYKHET